MDGVTDSTDSRDAGLCSCGLSVDLRDDPRDSAVDNGKLDEFEIRLIGMLCSNLPIKEIAGQVGYSQRHVERRIKELYSRIGVGSRHEAAYIAGRLGLAKVDA